MSANPPLPTVTDASVAVKWLIDEPRADLAVQLYDDASASGHVIVAPALLSNEVVNAVFRQWRRGEILEEEADAAVARFTTLNVRLLAPPQLVPEAYRFAKLHRLGAIYDSLYVVLARDLGGDLWTDDHKLLNAVARSAPWVRWIGHYPDGVA